MKVVLKDLTKKFSGQGKNAPDVIAVNNFNVEIPDGKLIGLLGPSGCGKSTALNLISGLLSPTAGRIFFGEDDVTDLPPENRGVGLVFQNYALYPHLTVKQNILFPLQNLKGEDKLSKEEMLARAYDAAKLVQIEGLMDRKPKALSGGQQQRVAIARALVKMPRVLLLDEPLSNLDAKLRVSMRTEIHALHKRIGKTFIYVTHDQVEAMTMGTVVAVMRDGVMQQAGEPTYLYENPANLFVAQFIGTPPMNVYEATFADGAVALLGQKLPLSPLQIRRLVRPKERVYAGFRPEYGLRLKREGDKYCYSAVVDLVEELGYEKIVYATFDADESCSATVVTDKSTNVRRGDKVEIAVDPEGIYLFDKETEIKVLDRTKKFYTD